MNLFLYFWLFLKASLFSSGGTGNLPSLHTDLLAQGWAREQQFGEALAVGQISPGPSGLWVISLGYLTAGPRGALLSLVAITLPPLLIIGVDRLYRRVQHHPAVEGFVRGLGLAVVGIFIVVLYRLLHSVGLDTRSVLIALGSLGLGATRRVPIVVILLIAALIGAITR
jgi:chromate transporter